MRRILLGWWLVLVVATLGGGPAAVHAAPPVAVAGVMEMSGWDLGRDGILALDGEWQFVPHALVGPMDPWPAHSRMLRVPGPWNATLASSHGFGSYRLLLKCASKEPLALAVPLEHSATRWFVNGRQVTQHGAPGISRETHAPTARLQLVNLPDGACPMELRVQVSNYEMVRGGLYRSVQLGTRDQLSQRRESALMRSQLALGAMLFLGVFTLMVSPWRRPDGGGLLFALFTFSYAISLGMIAERPLQPFVEWLGFNGQMRLLFANWAIGPALLALMLRRLYPAQGGTIVPGLFAGFCGSAFLLTLVAPVHVFTHSTSLIVGAGLAVALHAFVVLFKAQQARRRGARWLLVGLVLLVTAGWHDALFAQHLLTASLLPYGMLGFELALALMLAQRFARALAAEDLRIIEQRERTDMLVRATKAGLSDWDPVHKVLLLSDRFKEMFGYPADADNIVLPDFRDMLHPDDREEVTALLRHQLRQRDVRSGIRQFKSLDYRMRRADGEYIWVHAEAIGVCGPDGRVLRLISSLIDITASKRHEEALSTERERLNLLVRATQAGFGDWDAVRDTVSYSGRFKEMLGYPPDAPTDDWPSLFEMMHPDDREPARKEFAAMIRRKPTSAEQVPGEPMSYRLMRRDGSYIWIYAEGIALVDESGRTRRFITSYLDVTKLHEQEEALRAQMALTRTEQRRLDLVVRAALVGIVDWDGHTHATYYSPRFREIRGYPADADTQDWPDYFRVMIHPEDRKRITSRWVTFIQGKGPEGPRGEYYAPEQYRLLRADGSYAWVEVSGIAVRDDNGFVVRWIAAIIDITERRSQHEALRESRDQIAAQAAQLEQQNEALKENVRLREEVERIGRHDLKTPLNSIVAVPRLLREERHIGPEADELLGIVERAGYRILSMVNLSLDLYKMEQGSYIFRPDAVDLAELAGKVIAEVRMHAATKQVQLQLRALDPPYAWAEELLCYSLLANLLKNAVEASPEGGLVEVKVEPGDAGSVRVRIHNMGAVPEAIRALFFRKYTTLGKASGTGLGSYSAWLMAKVQDGFAEMETSQERGTTLSVTLRAAPPGKVPATTRHASDAPGPESSAIRSLAPMRVLLVDDDEYNLLIVRRYLPSPPFTIDIAINGRVAISAAELQWPDLVLMDLDMPVMGGMEAVGKLRELQASTGAGPCAMVALSSHDDPATQQAALDAGFDRYMTKPVTREAIHTMLFQLNAAAGAAPQSAPIQAVGSASACVPEDAIFVDADFEPIIDGFMASRRELLEQTAAAGLRDDRAEVRRIAHQLAGSFALYGFAWASQRSRWLEDNCAELAPSAIAGWAAQLRRHLDTVDIRFEREQA